MSSGHTVIECRYCGDPEEFPTDTAPPDFICDTCWALVSVEG